MVSCPSMIPTEQLHALLTEDTYRKCSNYSAKNFNSNLQLVLLFEAKNTSKDASGA